MKQILGLAAAIGVTSVGFLALAIGPAFAEASADAGPAVVVAAE